MVNVLLKQKTLLIVRALYFCMERNWAKLEKEFNISPAQQHILFLLSTNMYELTPTQLSELGCWHISTVTRLLKPLQESGFVKVTANKDQNRFKRVTITDSGKQLLIELMDAFKDMEQMPFDMGGLTEEEFEKFLSYGQRILTAHKGDDFMNQLLNARVENYDYAN